MTELAQYLSAKSRDGLVAWSIEAAAAEAYALSAHQVEAAILDAGLLPARYARNLGSLGLDGQLCLHRSAVAVIGCGGLGGHLLEGLARLGVGRLTAVDPDCFDETNLNRQLLSTIGGLGEAKVDAAACRVAAINPAAILRPLRLAFSAETAAAILDGQQLVMDGLDSVIDRIALSEACAARGLALVHGAVAGCFLQLAVQTGTQPGLARLFTGSGQARGDETRLGNQAFGPAAVAALQVAEACKLLTGQASPLEGRLYSLDLSSYTAVSFPLA